MNAFVRIGSLPCLSPVRTHNLMPAAARFAMAWGTPSWSLSSMAVAPLNCREEESNRLFPINTNGAPNGCLLQRLQPNDETKTTLTNQYKILFDFFVHSVDGLLSVVQSYRGFMMLLRPLFEVHLVDVFISQTQRPQSLPGEFLCIFPNSGE